MNRKMDAFEKQLRATNGRTRTLQKQIDQYWFHTNQRAVVPPEQKAPLEVEIEDLFGRILSSIEKRN